MSAAGEPTASAHVGQIAGAEIQRITAAPAHEAHHEVVAGRGHVGRHRVIGLEDVVADRHAVGFLMPERLVHAIEFGQAIGAAWHRCQCNARGEG